MIFTREPLPPYFSNPEPRFAPFHGNDRDHHDRATSAWERARTMPEPFVCDWVIDAHVAAEPRSELPRAAGR